jgi:signal transduction histidine kinase
MLPMPVLRRRLLEYGLAVVAVALALLVRALLGPLVGDHIPFLTILGSVAVAVGFGGLYPALLAVVLGYLGSSWLFVHPPTLVRLDTAADAITLASYLFACASVILLGVMMRRAQRRHMFAAERLARLNQRKDDLLATVAHEMRNPLAPIANAAALLRSDNVSPATAAHAAEVIERQVDQLSRLVDDLVAMDRIARQGLELRRHRVSLVSLVERAVEARRPLLDARRHALALRVPGHPLYLDADPDRLEQVVVNLLTNAVKFTPDGGRIEIVLEGDDGHATIRVRDSGIGISPDALPMLFVMFFRAEPTRPGLGIRLALVRQLVDMHGGTVSAQSDGPGHGSEFVVRLPLCADQGDGDGVPVEAEVASDEAPAGGRPLIAR